VLGGKWWVTKGEWTVDEGLARRRRGWRRVDISRVVIMRWKETAHISVLSAGCSCETRLRVACRRTAALSRLLSHRARHDDSLHIHPFHPPEGKGRAADGAKRLQPNISVIRALFLDKVLSFGYIHLFQL